MGCSWRERWYTRAKGNVNKGVFMPYWMMRVVKWLSTNPWWEVLRFLIGLISVITAIALFFVNRRTKKPLYAKRSINLVNNLVSKISGLQMQYAGQQIENLTITQVALWNAGRETINSDDIASSSPLTVRVKNGKSLLDANIIFTKNPANKFAIVTAQKTSEVTIQFEYFDKDEGIILQLIHKGTSNKDIEISGIIKGFGEIKREYMQDRIELYTVASVVRHK